MTVELCSYLYQVNIPIGHKVEGMAANGASAFRQLLNLGVFGRSDDSINRNNMKRNELQFDSHP
jgi:hypothetical protein